MASRATVQRQRSSEKVVASGRTHKGLIGASVTERYGEPAGLAAETLVTAIADRLEARTSEMVARDDAHEAELGDDPEARDRRDEASLCVREKLVETREQLTVLGGETYVTRIGFVGETPNDPVSVLRLGTAVVNNMAEVPPPAPKVAGYQLDPELWRAPLAEAVAGLEGLTAEVATEEREAEATMTTKHAAIDAYDKAFSETANLVSTMLAVAGEAELAKRVRPSTRRPGQTAEDAPAEGAEEAVL